jgi:hypothetical protein
VNLKRQAEWKRRVRRRFKHSFKGTLRDIQQKNQEALDLIESKHYMERRKELERHTAEVVCMEERMASVAREIARVRLEISKTASYGTRFMMTATMEQGFMMGAANLKDIGPYIIEHLTALIRREFAQIDFTRMKPVVPDTQPGKDWRPSWVLDSQDNNHRTY